MTDKLLHGMAAQAANMVKLELRYKDSFSGLLGTYFEGEGFRRMKVLEKLAVDRFGPDWIANGEAKSAVWGTMREAVKHMPAHALVVASLVDIFDPTEAMEALPIERQKEIIKEMHPRRQPQYFTQHEAVASVAQTPERVCILQFRLKHGLFIGEPDVMFAPQCEFHGRMKMFGEVEEGCSNASPAA